MILLQSNQRRLLNLVKIVMFYLALGALVLVKVLALILVILAVGDDVVLVLVAAHVREAVHIHARAHAGILLFKFCWHCCLGLKFGSTKEFGI